MIWQKVKSNVGRPVCIDAHTLTINEFFGPVIRIRKMPSEFSQVINSKTVYTTKTDLFQVLLLKVSNLCANGQYGLNILA